MDIEREIEGIKERNEKVEADKAWELSWTRKILIAIITYLLIVLFMYIAELSRPFIGAIVPAVQPVEPGEEETWDGRFEVVGLPVHRIESLVHRVDLDPREARLMPRCPQHVGDALFLEVQALRTRFLQ